jgi:hypothetical protein
MISAIAADPTASGRVAVAWPERIDDGNSRIMLRWTADGGAHWSPRIDVADDPVGVADQHDHVALRWLPDGRLAVAWRDRRGAGGTWNSMFQEWVRLLAPDGRAGLAPVGHAVELSNGPQTPESPALPAASHRGAAMPDEFRASRAHATL